MFEHSVKVPRHFKVAANIFKKVSTEGGSVKTLLYDDKLRHFRTNALFALLSETIKHAADIDKIFEFCSLLKNEPRLDPWLAKVLTAELLFGKKALPGKSKPEQTILSYKEQFEKYTSEHQDDLKTEATRRPRYVRINTNLLTTSDAIRAFQDEGYHFVRCTSGSYNDYLEQIQKLSEYDFTQDYHVKTIFVFPSGTRLHEHELYLENKIILQDKATAMAAYLLAPPPGSVVLDMCAAPGMKTTQIAAYMRNQGKIYAVERNEKRYQTLCDFVEKTGSTCVETLHKDSLEIKRGDYDDVEYILLDPSCSGSGMELTIYNYTEESRVAKLTSLQEKFLKHAMNSFPNAKKIVYSTCSLFSEENERVITNVVKTSRAKWRVQDTNELLKGQWNNFGSGMYGSMGARCLYAKPDSDLTIGFFLAVLERDQKDLEKNQKEVSQNGEVKRKKEKEETQNGDAVSKPVTETKKISKKKKTKIEHNVENKMDETQESIVENNQSRKKKKKKKQKSEDENIEDNEVVGKDDISNENINETQEIIIENNQSNKKKRKRNREDDQHEANESVGQDIMLNAIDVLQASKVHKKKKDKRKSNENSYEELHEITEVQSDNIEDKGLRKKKRKNTAIENDCESQLKEENTSDETPSKKKKKKSNKQENIETESALDIEKSEVPKKKKKKKLEIVANDIL